MPQPKHRSNYGLLIKFHLGVSMNTYLKHFLQGLGYSLLSTLLVYAATYLQNNPLQDAALTALLVAVLLAGDKAVRDWRRSQSGN